jgi:hypothetical protein
LKNRRIESTVGQHFHASKLGSKTLALIYKIAHAVDFLPSVRRFDGPNLMVSPAELSESDTLAFSFAAASGFGAGLALPPMIASRLI